MTMPTMTATSLYLVTVRYLTAGGTSETRGLTVAAPTEENAVELARVEVLRSSPPPRGIIGTTVIRVKEPAR